MSNKQDLENKIRDYELGMEEREDNPDSIDIKDPTNSGKDRGVEPSMIPVVDFLNNNGYDTIACCSGVLEEHYNINQMKEKVPIQKFTDYINNANYPIIRQPWIRIEPLYHNISKDSIEMDPEYFDLKNSVSYYSTQIGDTKCGPYWEIKVEIDSRPLYTMTFMKDVCNTRLHKSDTYEEYDTFVRQSIQTLFECLYRFVKDAYVPEGIHNIYSKDDFKTLKDSDVPNIINF